MKKALCFLCGLFLLLSLVSCKETAEAVPPAPTPVTTGEPMPDFPPWTYMSDEDFEISVGEVWYSFSDTDLVEALGTPEQTGEKRAVSWSDTIFTYEAAYDGVTAELWNMDYDTASTGEFWAYKLVLTEPGIKTWRGIEVGDTREDFLDAYPECKEQPMDEQGYYCSIGAGEYMICEMWFELDENDVVMDISYHYNTSN